MSSSSLGHSADATRRSSADYRERNQKRRLMNSRMRWKIIIQSTPFLFIFFMCELSALIHRPPALMFATNSFACYGPQRMADGQNAERRGGKKKGGGRREKLFESTRGKTVIITLPSLIPLIPLHLSSDAGWSSYVLENVQHEAKVRIKNPLI